MRHASVWLLAPIIALTSLTLFACGDDDGGSGDDGDNTPKAGTNGAGGPSGSGGSGPSGGTGSGGRPPSSGNGNVNGNTKLSDIDTSEEAQAACQRAASSLDEADLEAALQGACTFEGIIAEFAGGDCEQVKAQCLAEGGGPGEPTECAPEDIPNCDVTVDAYIACSVAQTEIGAAFFKNITCSTDLATLPQDPPETPSECVSVYEACPELRPDLE
jgi:hypothetical protein